VGPGAFVEGAGGSLRVWNALCIYAGPGGLAGPRRGGRVVELGGWKEVQMGLGARAATAGEGGVQLPETWR
jgi:hypothetical protein